MRWFAVALVLIAAPEARADDCNHLTPTPAVVEWTGWLGFGTGDPVFAMRAGAAVDFELMQIKNPWRYGGPFEIRWGPWLAAETHFDRHFFEAGLALDVGQTKHASFGTYTLRIGGGVDDDRRAVASLTVLGGVRYVPGRFGFDDGVCEPRTTAFASGGRVFATARTDFEGATQYVIGIELEPTWVLPPYSLGKLAGARSNW